MNTKTKDALRASLPLLTSINDLMELIATRISCEDAPLNYAPPDGWHTISLNNVGDDVHPVSLRIWMRLFDQYIANRKGAVIWKVAPYLDREKREISATFCVDSSMCRIELAMPSAYGTPGL